MLSTAASTIDENLPIPRRHDSYAEHSESPRNFPSKSHLAAGYELSTPVTPDHSRAVNFSTALATVVDEVDDQGDPETIWYSKRELRTFRSSAKAMADRTRLRQPSLVQELVDAYGMAKDERTGGGQSTTKTPFGKWSKLGSSRRGLERWVFTKEDRAVRAEEVKASRSIVLNLQCLLQRSGATDQEELLRQQYVIISKPAVIIAQQMGQADEEVGKKYFSKAANEDDDDETFDDEKSVTTILSSMSSESLSSCTSSVCSLASMCSRGGKKLKHSGKNTASSKRKSSRRRRRSKDKSTATPGRRASTSPLRRLQDSFSNLNRSL